MYNYFPACNEVFQQNYWREVSGCRRGIVLPFALLTCSTALIGSFIPMFRDTASVTNYQTEAVKYPRTANTRKSFTVLMFLNVYATWSAPQPACLVTGIALRSLFLIWKETANLVLPELYR